MRHQAFFYFILFTVSCLIQPAAAESLRCGTALILVGDSKLKVRERCGNPLYRDIISGDLESRVEEWVYPRGSREFPMVLTIRGQRVIRIERLDE